MSVIKEEKRFVNALFILFFALLLAKPSALSLIAVLGAPCDTAFLSNTYPLQNL